MNLAPSTFVRELPGDAVRINIPRQVRGALYSAVDPTPVKAPRLLAWSDDLADFLGLERPSKEQVDMLAGNQTAPGTQPTRRAMAATSSANGRASLATGVPSRWAR